MEVVACSLDLEAARHIPPLACKTIRSRNLDPFEKPGSASHPSEQILLWIITLRAYIESGEVTFLIVGQKCRRLWIESRARLSVGLGHDYVGLSEIRAAQIAFSASLDALAQLKDGAKALPACAAAGVAFWAKTGEARQRESNKAVTAISIKTFSYGSSGLGCG